MSEKGISSHIHRSMEVGILCEACAVGEPRRGRFSGRAVGRSISPGVPDGFEMLTDIQASKLRKLDQTPGYLKDPKWKQFVKRFQGFVKRVRGRRAVEKSANISTATVWPVKAGRPGPVTGVAVPKVPIWQRRNLAPPPPLDMYKMR